MKYLLYTTSSSDWYQKRANDIAREWSRIKGAEPVTIDVVYKTIPKSPVFIIDEEGHRRFAWDWFENYFDTSDYDGAFFHFTPYYKKKWFIPDAINGAKHTHRKDKPFFWLCCSKELANGYDLLYTFERLMYHEMAHFYEDLDNNIGNALQQESVHITDYKLKKIHYYHHFIDLRGWELRRQVDRLLVKIIQLVNKYI